MKMRYKSVETFAAKETQRMGLETAAWQTSIVKRPLAYERLAIRRRGLHTTRVGVDLPVFMEWSTCAEDGHDACDEGADNKSESDVNRDAIVFPKPILFVGVS